MADDIEEVTVDWLAVCLCPRVLMLERDEGQREGVAYERDDGAGDGGKASAAVSESGGGRGAGRGLSYT